MFFVAERAADIAQMRVMRIDLNDRTAGVAVRVVVGIGYCLAFVLTVTADAGVLSGRLCGEAWPRRGDLIPGPWAG